MITWIIRILARLQRCQLLTLFGVSPVRIRAFQECQAPSQKVSDGLSTVWFHASSLGELEMLRPLIDDLTQRDIKVGVSVFSESAISALHEIQDRLVFAGFSPREDQWEDFFKAFGVRKIVLSKYDFWPGLLRGARVLSLPLIVVNAEWRRSLDWMVRLFACGHEPLPDIRFLVNHGENASIEELVRRFGARQVKIGMNPRFERVSRRITTQKDSHARQKVEAWLKRIAQLPRPILMVGSAWPEDLDFLLPELFGFTGALVVVPHVLNKSELDQFKGILERALPGHHLLVEEMGILVELYGAADRAFVGGGFGKGIHSTLEPAVCGIPTACGPKRVDRFPETRDLIRSGALVVCQNRDDLRQWLENSKPKCLSKEVLDNLRNDYQRLLEECL
jgi:3-deoxy-D-manno-octulosonic-acid transferase